MLLRVLTFSFLCLFTISAGAEEVNSQLGNAVSIPDGSGSAVSTVTIMEGDFVAGHVISGADFTLNNFQHDWVGDLIVTVHHSISNKSATLFSRVNQTQPNGPGDSSKLNGNYTFKDNGASFWSAAANSDNGEMDIVAAGIYAASGANESDVSLNNTFLNQTPEGVWTFTFSDLEGGNLGSVGSTSVHLVTAVPEPGTMAGISLLGMFGGLYLRRRHLKKKNAAVIQA